MSSLNNRSILDPLPDYTPAEPQPHQVIDPLTGDFTLEEKIRRLKEKLNKPPEPIFEEPPKALEPQEPSQSRMSRLSSQPLREQSPIKEETPVRDMTPTREQTPVKEVKKPQVEEVGVQVEQEDNDFEQYRDANQSSGRKSSFEKPYRRGSAARTPSETKT
jgi:hypothetical protein